MSTACEPASTAEAWIVDWASRVLEPAMEVTPLAAIIAARATGW
jgi:hypothetical protein